MEFNKVDKALKSVGVDLKDVNGQFRNLDEVFLELSSKWDGLSRNAQRYVATIAAGSRQQSRFIALMDNYERTSELIKIAEDSAGKTEEQFAKAADTVEFKINALKTAWEEFRLALVNQKWYKGIIDGITEIVNSIKDMASNGIWSVVGMAVGVLFAKSAFAGFRDQLLSFGTSIKSTIAAYADMKIQINEQSKQNVQNEIQEVGTKTKVLQDELNNLVINIKNKEALQAFENELLEIRQTLLKLQNGDIDTVLGALEANIGRTKGYKQNKPLKSLNGLTESIAKETGKSTKQIETFFKQLGIKSGQTRKEILAIIEQTRSDIQNKIVQTQKYLQNAKFTPITSITNEEVNATVGLVQSLEERNQAETKLIATQEQLNQAEQQAVALQERLRATSEQATSSTEKWIALKNAITTMEPALKMLVGQYGMIATSLMMGADATTVFKTSLFAFVPQIMTTAAQFGMAAAKALIYRKQLQSVAGKIATNTILSRYKTAEALKEAAANGKLVISEAELATAIKQRSEATIISEKELTIATEQRTAATMASNAAMSVGLMLAGLAVAALFAYGKALAKANKTGLELAETNRKIADSQSLVAKSNRKEVEDTVNESSKLLEKYQELNKVQNKNTEQQEEFDSILSEIKEKYPEFITYYGTMNDQVSIQVDQWKEILETQKEILKINQAIEKASEGAAERAKRQEQIAQLEKKRQALEVDRNSYNWSDTIVDSMRSKYNIPTGMDAYNWLDEQINSIDDQIKLLKSDTANEISKFAEANSIKTGSHYLRSLTAVGVNQQNQLSGQGEIEQTFKTLYDKLNYNEQQSIKQLIKDGEEYIINPITGEINSGFFDIEKRADTRRALNNVITIMQSIQGLSDGNYFSGVSDKKLDQIVSGEISGKELNEIYKDYEGKAEQNVLDVYKNAYNIVQNEVRGRLGRKADFSLSTQQLTDLNQQLIDIQDKIGESATKILISAFDKNVDTATIQKFISQNHLDDINLLNFSSIIAAVGAEFGSAAASKLYGATNFTSADVLSASDQQGELLDKLTGQENVFQSIAQGKATSNTVKKMLKEFGLENELNLTEYYTGNKLTKGGALLTALREALIDNSQANLAKAYNATIGGTEEDKQAYEILKLQNQELLAFADNVLSAKTAIDDLFDEIKKKGKTVSDTISSFYSSGFISTDVIAQLKEAFKNDKNFDINYFVNDNLTLNTERLLKYYKETEIARLNAEIEILKEQHEDITEIVLKRDALLREIDEAQKKALEDKTKKQKEYTDKLRDQEKALKDIADKQKDLNKAYEDYNKLLYGSDFFKSSLGNLYNYEVLLSEINDEITRTKELFEDSNTYQDAMNTLDKYLKLLHKRQAYNEAMLAQYRAGMEQAKYELENSAFISYEGILANYSDYIRFDERTGEALIDKELLEQARINDEVKKNIEELVKTYNENASKVRQIEDELIKAQKELLEMRKQATATMADFESSIADRLKEQYQKEVDALRNKYDSMKQADDDYVSALQEALEKQRKLREQEKEWQDLSTKEKQLSLMSRDTSGANEIERQKLEKEIEESRQQLLDNTIDRAVESMEKLYESQDELRQAEIEVKEALIEDSSYWNMAAHNVAENLTSFDDYYDQVLSKDEDYLNMTQVQREKFLNEETDNYNNAMQAAAILTIDNIENIEQILAISGEEIENTIVEVSDVFSLNVSKTIQEVQTALDTQIEDAKTKISNAITALDEANTKYAEICKQVKDLYDQIVGIAGENGNQYNPTPPTTMNANAQSAKNHAEHPESYFTEIGENPESQSEWQGPIKPGPQGPIKPLSKTDAMQLLSSWATTVDGKRPTAGEIAEVIHDINYAIEHGQGGTVEVDNDKISSIFQALKLMSSLNYSIDGYSPERYWAALELSEQFRQNIGRIKTSWYENGVLYGFKSGGLVNYTGPAWVDGTPQQPEAFLSPEDTERIGNAAKLLANLPLLNPTANISSTNTSYGDTKVEITLNIDKLSSDVDIDNMIERVKNSIVEVARPVGSNVILQQQI